MPDKPLGWFSLVTNYTPAWPVFMTVKFSIRIELEFNNVVLIICYQQN